MNIDQALGDLTIELETIEDEKLRGTVQLLLNVVEYLVQENRELRKENQELKDEIKRLKGEKGKPLFGLGKKLGKGRNHSSEKERQGTEDDKEKGKLKPKIGDLKIDRREDCKIDKAALPADAIFKGYETVVIQDIKILTDNVAFQREVYYSPSTGKTYTAELPAGYEGQFGPAIKALILSLYQDSGMTQPAMKRFFETHGIYISAGTISNVITEEIEIFHQEKIDIFEAGLKATDYQHMDDTKSSVNGKHHHNHIVCSPLFTAYNTEESKDRLSAIRALTHGKMSYALNEKTYEKMRLFRISEQQIERCRRFDRENELMNQEEFDAVMKLIFPNPRRFKEIQKLVRDAAAISAYEYYPHKVKILITDDAARFRGVTEHQGLCWIHAGRHYKVLSPIIYRHRKLLENFREEFWQYYRRLIDYKKAPTDAKAEELSKDFDTLFSRKTCYEALNERIKITLSHKKELLLVLKFPHIPLHNNPAENGARIQARKRDISFQTRNAKGTKAKDTIMTIVETAKKLRVNIFDYIYDRMSNKCEMTSLADLIRQRATTLATC